VAAKNSRAAKIAAENKKKNLNTRVPFDIFVVRNPNMRNVTPDYVRLQPYADAPEFKFFNAK
jgi:hypothetical protein